MIKAPMSLQDLQRRIYVKAKAEPSWWCCACTEPQGLRLEEVEEAVAV